MADEKPPVQEEKKPAEKKDKTEKKPAAKKIISQKWKMFDLSGEKVARKRKSCPKCGDGVFLAHHATRDSCGTCGYTEFRRTEEKKK